MDPGRGSGGSQAIHICAEGMEQTFMDACECVQRARDHPFAFLLDQNQVDWKKNNATLSIWQSIVTP